MEFSNIKLEWNTILSRQIESLQEQFVGTDIKKLFVPIVDLLTNNKIPSRVMISGGKARAYSYVMESSVLDDRLIFTMGFDSDSVDNLDRGKAILDWIEQMSSESKKLAIIDNVFNGTFLMQELKDRGFVEDKRIKLKSALSALVTLNSKMKSDDMDEIEILGIHDVPVDDLEIAQEKAYRGSPEYFLLNMKDGKNQTYKILFDGYYGRILSSPSSVLYKNGIIGSCMISDGSEEFVDNGVPLVVDIFISHEFRRKGLTGVSLLHAAEKLDLLGHKFLQLWVNDHSPAMLVYKKLGMKETGEEEILHWKNFRQVPAEVP